jgi:hypothetical protein
MQLTLKAESSPAPAVPLSLSENRGMNSPTLLGSSPSVVSVRDGTRSNSQKPKPLQEGGQEAAKETWVPERALHVWHRCRGHIPRCRYGNPRIYKADRRALLRAPPTHVE